MTTHFWGDKDFDWTALHRAMRMIKRLSKLLGLRVYMKEKYGTIRYEHLYLWSFSTYTWLASIQTKGFLVVLFLTCCRYRAVAPEILDDWAVNWGNDKTHKHYVPLLFKPFLKENPWRYTDEI